MLQTTSVRSVCSGAVGSAGTMPEDTGPITVGVQLAMSAIAKEMPITATYRGVLPSLATDFIRLALLILFPSLVLVLARLLA